MSIDDDKAFTSFIIANGAEVYCKLVMMFFTFWSLDVKKHLKKSQCAKRGMEGPYDIMLSCHAGQLQISKKIQAVMNQKTIDSLPTMVEKSQKMVVCTMSMDINEEEIIESIDFGDVATYIGNTMDTNLNMFI